jgi:hypothetical protein
VLRPPIERLERAVETLERAARTTGLAVAPPWLRRGIREVRASLRSRDVDGAAAYAERLVLRLEERTGSR